MKLIRTKLAISVKSLSFLPVTTPASYYSSSTPRPLSSADRSFSSSIFRPLSRAPLQLKTDAITFLLRVETRERRRSSTFFLAFLLYTRTVYGSAIRSELLWHAREVETLPTLNLLLNAFLSSLIAPFRLVVSTEQTVFKNNNQRPPEASFPRPQQDRRYRMLMH